jgi:hypothetical protein
MPSYRDGLSGQELVNRMSEYIVEILTYAYEKATPLVRYKPPPIGGFLTRTTLRHLAHAKRLYRTLVRTVEDESKPYVRAKLKVINKANRWRIRKDREAWELKRLHMCKERGNNFYKWMNDVTRTTSKIGPILSQDGKLKATDNEMAPELNDYLCNLMTPSTIHHINWDVKHKPKEYPRNGHPKPNGKFYYKTVYHSSPRRTSDARFRTKRYRH